MATLSLATLLVSHTKAEIYSFALKVAKAIGLPVSSWQPGDPTRSLYHVESEFLADVLEPTIANYIASGFLDYAHGIWLKILAKQVFNVDVPDATYATADVVLTNNGACVYDFDPNDVTLKSTISGKTYRNIATGGHLAAKVGSTPGTLTLTFVADEPGSASSAGAGEIDAFVTVFTGVTTCSNAIAAVGSDEQDESVTVQQCRDKLGSFSDNGPKEGYAFTARNPARTGTNAVTRVRVYSASDTGRVQVYLAGPAGGVSGPDLALVTTAILKWSTPLCITPTVSSATNVVVPVTYELWIYKSCNKTTDQVAADIETALETLFKTRPIGGDIIPPAASGKLYLSLVDSTIRGVFPQTFRNVTSLPVADVAIANGQVAALGTVTATIHIVSDP